MLGWGITRTGPPTVLFKKAQAVPPPSSSGDDYWGLAPIFVPLPAYVPGAVEACDCGVVEDAERLEYLELERGGGYQGEAKSRGLPGALDFSSPSRPGAGPQIFYSLKLECPPSRQSSGGKKRQPSARPR